MAGHRPDDESQWAADKRDFVADTRDELAAEREAAADVRDLTADARETALDEREQLLDARAAQLVVGPDAAEGAQRAEARDAREQCRKERERAHAERETAGHARAEAADRRHSATPTTRLAATFAAIAESLYGADSYDAVLLRIAEAAVSTVSGCDMASVTLHETGRFRTAATTSAAASAVDQAQYEAGEGPCLDAIDSSVVYAPRFPDDRWPTLGVRLVERGVRSAASFRLAAATPTRATTSGSLNTYSGTPDAFSVEAQEIGLILAAHASMAASIARERGDLRAQAQQLSTALMTRDVIGQAKGILMERLRLTPEQAFDALRRSSNRLNEKLHTVASALAETGEFDATEAHDATPP